MGKSQEVKYADQLAVFRRGEGTFEVEVTADNVLHVGVNVLPTKTKVSDKRGRHEILPAPG